MPGRNRRGYVLLVVMAVSVMVVTVLSTLAKVSLRRGLEAADAERSLQMRWGSLTLSHAMLDRAPKWFEEREKLTSEISPGTVPPVSVRSAITLGDVTFDMLLADEDAKANLNSIYHHGGTERVQRAISQVMGSVRPGTIRLTPAVPAMSISRESRKASVAEKNTGDDESDAPKIPAAFRSWGEVFDVAQLEADANSEVALPNLTMGMTCWGNGQLNIRRASDEAFLAVAGLVVQDGGAQRLLKRYRQSPTMTLQVMLIGEVTSPADQQHLKELLSETSTNFSLWIDASTKNGRNLRNFHVMQRDEEGVTQHNKFAQ